MLVPNLVNRPDSRVIIVQRLSVMFCDGLWYTPDITERKLSKILLPVKIVKPPPPLQPPPPTSLYHGIFDTAIQRSGMWEFKFPLSLHQVQKGGKNCIDDVCREVGDNTDWRNREIFLSDQKWKIFHRVEKWFPLQISGPLTYVAVTVSRFDYWSILMWYIDINAEPRLVSAPWSHRGDRWPSGVGHVNTDQIPPTSLPSSHLDHHQLNNNLQPVLGKHLKK